MAAPHQHRAAGSHAAPTSVAAPLHPAAYHDSDFFEDLPAALRGKVARYRTRPCVANSELGQAS